MEKYKLSFSRKDIWLFLYLFFYTEYQISKITMINLPGKEMFLVIAFAIGVIKIITSLYFNINRLISILVIGFVVIMSLYYFNFSDTRMLIFYVTSLCIFNEDIKKVISILFYLRLFNILFIITLGGWSHPNAMAFYFAILILLYVCKLNKTVKMGRFFILLILCITIYIINPTSFMFLVAMSLLFIFLIASRFKLGRKMLVSKAVIFIYPIAFFINLFFTMCIGETKIPIIGKFIPGFINETIINLANTLNDYLSSRLLLSKLFIDSVGIALFADTEKHNIYRSMREMASENNVHFLVDTGYTYLIGYWGLIVTIIMLCIGVISMKYFVERKMYNFIIAGIICAVWPMVEDLLFEGIILIFFVKALYDNKNTVKKLQ